MYMNTWVGRVTYFAQITEHTVKRTSELNTSVFVKEVVDAANRLIA